MRTLVLFVVLFASLPAGAAEPGGFAPLFNGTDFTGWKAFARAAKGEPTKPVEPKGSWSVGDGVLKCTGTPTGYLATEKEYGDYILRVKWRYPAGSKGGNSGVLLHCQAKDEVWPPSIEAQMRSGFAGDLWLNTPPETKLDIAEGQKDPKAVRHVVRTAVPAEKPFGEWNEYEITCRGGDIRVVVNGTAANAGANGNLTRGRIALQSEVGEVHFKDITLKPLK